MAALHGEDIHEDETMPIVGHEIFISDSSEPPSRGLSDEDFDPSKLLGNSKTSDKQRARKALTKPKPAPKPATTKARTSVNRELERLYMDEGAANIFREMAQKGTTRRSVTTVKESSPVAPKTRSPRRTSRTYQNESEIKKKKKLNGPAKPAIAAKITEDQDQEPWDTHQSSNKNDRQTTFVPRKLTNPADASQIYHRRSYSSDSSTDDVPLTKKLKTSDNFQPDVQVNCSEQKGHQLALRDHGYTIVNKEEETFNSESITSELSEGCHEIHIRVDKHLLHVTLSPVSSKIPSSLNETILKELSVILRKLKNIPQVHVVLFTSSGTQFCTGFDFSLLLKDNLEERQEAARKMSSVIQDFITELANCDKILVGGLQGSVIGLGVTMLRYFDVVYACDKSTFFMPYLQLAQGTEGGVPLAFQNSSTSKSLMALLVYEGRRLTATEAQAMGLVDTVLWPASFREDLMPRVQKMARRSTQTLLASKKLCRASLRRKLPAVLKEESQLLRQSWISDVFQRRAASMLASGQILA